MIYEYAVDPNIFVTEEKACFVLESFGQDKGRLVSEIKKDHWINLIRNAINGSQNKPLAKHTLKEALKILVKKKKALYCRQIQVDGCDDWMQMTLKAHGLWPYRGILVEMYDGDNDAFLVKDIHLSDNEKWSVPPSLTIDREASSMVNAVEPILENAHEVMLVDRNFRLENQHGSPKNQYKRVLLEILRCLSSKKYGPTVNKVVYHIGKSSVDNITDSVINEIERQCKAHLLNDIPSGIKLEFAVWPWNQFHDRLLITETGCIDFGIGLDEYSGTNEKVITLKRISSADHSLFWKKYKGKPSDIVL